MGKSGGANPGCRAGWTRGSKGETKLQPGTRSAGPPGNWLDRPFAGRVTRAAGRGVTGQVLQCRWGTHLQGTQYWVYRYNSRKIGRGARKRTDRTGSVPRVPEGYRGAQRCAPFLHLRSPGVAPYHWNPDSSGRVQGWDKFLRAQQDSKEVCSSAALPRESNRLQI